MNPSYYTNPMQFEKIIDSEKAHEIKTLNDDEHIYTNPTFGLYIINEKIDEIFEILNDEQNSNNNLERLNGLIANSENIDKFLYTTITKLYEYFKEYEKSQNVNESIQENYDFEDFINSDFVNDNVQIQNCYKNITEAGSTRIIQLKNNIDDEIIQTQLHM